MHTPWALAHLPAAFPSPKDGGSAIRMISNCTLEPSGFQVGRAKCAGLLPFSASIPSGVPWGATGRAPVHTGSYLKGHR